MEKLLREELFLRATPLYGRKIKFLKPVGGGSIHSAWHINLEDGEQYFAKTNKPEAFSILNSEAEGLRHLAKFSDKNLLLVPQPISINKFSSFSILLMPWLSLSAGDQSFLGKGLARLHRSSFQSSPGKFGWGKDGYIGSGLQKGGWEENWGECFLKLRLLPQLELSKNWGLDISVINKISLQLVNFLNKHKPSPSLVHGDLWSGNASTLNNGKGVLIDPAIWWADREVDISMTRMFGGFSKQFYESYNKVWPLPKNYHEREDIYNLYHLLNHANIFGGSYKVSSKNSLKKIAKQVQN